MKLRKAIIALSILSILCFPAAFATGSNPSLSQIDDHIADSLKDIAKKYQTDFGGESLTNSNWKLFDYIRAACKRADLLKAPLSKAKDAGFNRIASDDGKLCIYNWDTLTGGTMHVYWALAQFQDGTKICCEPLKPMNKSDQSGDGGNWYDSIYTIKTKDNRTVYLVTGGGRGSTVDFGEMIQAYSISKGNLAPVLIFQTQTKKLLNKIDYWVHGENSASVEVSDDKQKVSIPVVTKEGALTDRSLIYKFNGYKFVFDAKLK